MNFTTPMPFSSLIGQPQAIELLTQAVTKNRIAPAYLFAGSDGVGRALAARCFSRLIFQATATKPQKHRDLKNHPDFLWVEPTYMHQGQRLTAAETAETGLKRKAPPQIRLEQIREISQFLGRPPLEATQAVVVIEQAETMSEAPANALLKTLEEPGRATLILIAPSVESLLPTLVSRCQRIPFYRLEQAAIVQVLQQVGRSQVAEDPAVMAMAEGSPGRAIACWEQLQEIPAELLGAIAQKPSTVKQALELAKQINKTLDTPAQLWLIDYLQQMYWQQQHHDPVRDILPIQKLETARNYLLGYVQPRLVWEVTLMEITAAVNNGAGLTHRPHR